MNIGIIGLGWLGLPLAKSLLNKGHSIFGTTRKRFVDLEHTNFNLQKYNPAEKENSLLDISQQVDLVVIAITPDRSSIRNYAKDCVKIVQQFTNKTQFILISSTSVYPHATGEYLESDIHPDYLHQTSIGYAEDTLGALLQNRLTIIRMAGLVGPERYPVLSMIKSQKPYAGNEPVNVIHQSDAIGIIEHVIENKITGKIINGVSSKHPLKRDFYTKMAKDLNREVPVWVDATSKQLVNRIIRNDLIIQLGYRFKYENPMDYPIA